MSDMNIETVTNNNNTEVISNEIKPKRGRGRPKKINASVDNLNTAVTTEAVEKNTVITTESTSDDIKPKRGRGRPKKIKTSDEKSENTSDEKSENTSDQKSENTSDQKYENTSDEKSENTSDLKSENTSDQKYENTSDQNSIHSSHDNNSEHSSKPNNSNNKKSLPPKYEKFLLFGVHLIKHILDSDIPFNFDNILSLSLFNSDIDSQIAFVDNFLSQIKNTKSFIYNFSNNNNNNYNNDNDNYNPFVDSLVKLANLHSNDNEHIHCQVFEFNNQKFLIDQLFNVRPLHDSNSIIGKFDIHSLNVNWL